MSAITKELGPGEGIQLVGQSSHQTDIQKFEFHQRTAKLFALSGLFADIKGQTLEQSLAQAYVKIALGDSMGFNPAESMTGIDIIQGRVAISANLRASRLQRSGYSWDILQLDDKGCRLAPRYKGEPLMAEELDGDTGQARKVPVVVSFTAEDAQRAGLLSKDNYKKNPRNMFFARAVTNLQRWYAPGVLTVNVLTVEEAEDLAGVAHTLTAEPNVNPADRALYEACDKLLAERGMNAAQREMRLAKEKGNLAVYLETLKTQNANGGAHANSDPRPRSSSADSVPGVESAGAGEPAAEDAAADPAAADGEQAAGSGTESRGANDAAESAPQPAAAKPRVAKGSGVLF